MVFQCTTWMVWLTYGGCSSSKPLQVGVWLPCERYMGCKYVGCERLPAPTLPAQVT